MADEPRGNETETGPDDFQKGDVIEIKPSVLAKHHKKGAFTPADLCGIGWPNRFQVRAVTKTKEGQKALVLDPCCRWMVHQATGEFLCVAHLADWFRRPREEKRRPDRQIVVKTPFGKLFQLDYNEDDDDPGMEIQVGSGQPLILGGKLSKFLGEKIKEAGFL